jgi:hypothetical protein
MSIHEVLTLALGLGEQDRAALAHQLLLSLSPPGPELADTAEWEAVAMEEVGRRAERYQRGETAARDWREALQNIQRQLRRSPGHGSADPSGS